MKESETKTQKQDSKGVKIAKAILNTFINILIVLVLIVSLLIAIMALSSKESGISTVFGYTIQPIQSNSMKGGSDKYPGGNFEKGDLMIAKATNYNEEATYQVGDIVTFTTTDLEGNDVLVSHRIVKVKPASAGYDTYQTWGDNREECKSPDQIEEFNYIDAGDIASVYYSKSYQGTILKGWGTPLDYLKTQQGFFFAVLLPMIIFFMYALIRVVLSATNYKKTKADEEKEEAVKEAVAAALAEKNGDEAKTAATPADMTPEQMEQFKQFMEFQKMQQEKQQEVKAEEPQEAEAEKPTEKHAEDHPAEDEV